MKIVRTKTRAEGGITDEEKIKLDEHAKKWIKIIERTEPIDKKKITNAIKSLYKVSGLKEPRVVVVDSPYVMALAGGLSAAVWFLRKTKWGLATYSATDSATRSATYSATDSATRSATYSATYLATYLATDSATRLATRLATASATASATRSATYSATDSATRSATRSATYSATDSATRSATYSATDSATYSATDLATRSATRSATYSATDSATRSATYSATDSATYSATDLATRSAAKTNWLRDLCKEFVGEDNIKLAIGCIKNYYNMLQGGNMWAQHDSYLIAARDILGLDLTEHKKYKAWEDCAKEGGYRIMHEEFCIVSNFPKAIHKDTNNQPHNDKGPQIEWRDGFATYYLHGVRFEKDLWEKVVSRKMPFQDIMAIKDVDQRRQAMKYGDFHEFAKWQGAKKIDEYTKIDINGNDVPHELWEFPEQKEDKRVFTKTVHFARYMCPSTREWHMKGVPEFKTIAEALSWGMSDEKLGYIVTPEEWKLMVPLKVEA